MLKFCIILFLLASLVLYGCTTTYNPATGQEEYIFVTTPMEVSIGNTLASKISSEFEFSKDDQEINRVTKIGERIVSVSDRKDLRYHFSVIEDDSLNAFTTPGGYIYINSGLIERATDDELAGVIGHEVGHVAARHIAKKLQAQIGYDILMNIATRKGNLNDLQQAASISYNLIMLGYSREDELLGDRLGVTYAYKAGYDPYAMITFLEKLKDAKGDEIGFVFLRSHPYVSQRIKMLEKQIPAIIERLDNKPITESVRAQEQKRVSPVPITVNNKRPLRVMCPKCKRIFSGKTNYCPYDGTRL